MCVLEVHKNIQTYIAIKFSDLGIFDENGSSFADATFQQIVSFFLSLSTLWMNIKN